MRRTMIRYTIPAGIILTCLLGSSAARQPNTVFILADDLGWNDVSFHGYNEIPTPNIDRLATAGVILNSHYGQYLCTPSRTALMTGKYPIRFGLQHWVIAEGEPRSVDLKEKLLPQYMKDLGYATHMVGKWHLGYYSQSCTPTFRGFDSFFGTYNAAVDYFTHVNGVPGKPYYGKDLKDNLESVDNYTGHYLTDIFTEKSIKVFDNHNFEQPLFLYVAHYAPHTAPGNESVQATEEYISRFPQIPDEGRRKFAGTIAALDDSIGKIYGSLAEKGVLDNTVIVLTSDNGGLGQEMSGLFGSGQGSNWPLRGMKGTHWEGGIRVPALVWGKGIANPGRVTNELFHMTDWLPTLVHLAGGETPPGLDGFDVWDSISDGAPSPRTEVLLQANPTANEYTLRWNHFKLMAGMSVYSQIPEQITGWYEPVTGINTSLQTNSPARLQCVPANPTLPPCDPVTAPCLFDVADDPCARNNLAEVFPDVVELLWQKILAYNASAVPPGNLLPDPNARPELHGGYTRPWMD